MLTNYYASSMIVVKFLLLILTCNDWLTWLNGKVGAMLYQLNQLSLLVAIAYLFSLQNARKSGHYK